MPVFDDPTDALNFKSKEEKRGLHCNITVDVFGSYLVTCGFPPSKEPARKAPKVQAQPSPTVPTRLVEFAEEFEPEQSTVPERERIEYGRPTRMNLPPMTGDYAYQREAVDDALANNDDLIELPTGRGKTNVGLQIINELGLPTLVIVPTIALLGQWQRVIERAGGKATIVGGGHNQWSPFTLITYQSAILNLGKLKDFKVFVFDEVHHAASPEYKQILRVASEISGQHMIGLSASISPDVMQILSRYFPHIYRKTLAEFQESSRHRIQLRVETLPVELDNEEFDLYSKWSDTIKAALRKHGNMGNWRYLMSSGSRETRMAIGAAFKAYSNRKKMLAEMPQKIDLAARVVSEHSGNFVIFTDTIATADTVYNRLEALGVPAIVIHSKKGLSLKQKQNLLDSLRDGRVRVLVGVSSIEEGIDVPNLDNAIFLSNSTSGEKKYIQRAGRILRPTAGKEATIYIIYARNTIEQDNLRTIRSLLGLS